MNLKEFIDTLAITPFIPGGERFIRLKDCPLLLEFCEENAIAVVRIETFQLRGNDQEGDMGPIMEYIMVFGKASIDNWTEYCQDCNNGAGRFFKEIMEGGSDILNRIFTGFPGSGFERLFENGPNFIFSFIFETQEEWWQRKAGES